MQTLKNVKLYLLDMDGTIYLDECLFDGVIEFLEHVKSVGGRYMFLTNNSSKSVDKYIEKLKSLGITATADDFLTSVDATVFYLKPQKYKKIYTLGTESFKQQLKQEGLPPPIYIVFNLLCILQSSSSFSKTFKYLSHISAL